MNTLIKVISFSTTFSLRKQNNPTMVEHGLFRGDPFIHPFLDFFATGEMSVSARRIDWKRW